VYDALFGLDEAR